jgi:hypothetical protein
MQIKEELQTTCVTSEVSNITNEIVGETQLLNNEGMMCCLGFYCNKTLAKKDLLGYLMPEEVMRGGLLVELEDKRPWQVNWDGSRQRFCNSDFADKAIAINDNDTLSDEAREHLLIDLFDEVGVDVIFYGEYPDIDTLINEAHQ